MKELVPTGKLRFGVAFAPKMSALFVIKQADGTPRGITADLGRALAKKLGVPVEFLIAPNTGVLTDALANAEIDVAFMPVDDERKKRLDFGPAYCLVESTYMVMPRVRHQKLGRGGPFRRPRGRRCQHHDDPRRRTHLEEHPADRGDVDRRRNHHAARWQGRCLRARPRLVAGLRRDVSRLVHCRRRLPADRDAIAVPKGRPAALANVTEFMREAKASGAVRRAMDRAGMSDLAVAP